MLLTSLVLSTVLTLPTCVERPPLPPAAATTAPLDPARDAVVIVAIEDSFALPDRQGVAEAGRAWQQWFTTTTKLPPTRVRLLADGEATLETMRDALTTAAASVDAGNRLWFIFIGHGVLSDEGEPMLLGADTQQSERSFKSRGLSRAHALELALTTKGAVVAIFDDTLGPDHRHDGKPLLPTSCGGGRRFAPRAVEPRLLQIAIDIFDTTKGYERPPLSYLLLGALRGWADIDADAVVTLDEATTFVKTRLAAVSPTPPRLDVVGNPASELSRCGAEKMPLPTTMFVKLRGNGAAREPPRPEPTPTPTPTSTPTP